MLEKFDASTCTPQEVLEAILAEPELPRHELAAIAKIGLWARDLTTEPELREMGIKAHRRALDALGPDAIVKEHHTLENLMAQTFRMAGFNPLLMTHLLPNSNAVEALRLVVEDGKTPAEALEIVTDDNPPDGG